MVDNTIIRCIKHNTHRSKVLDSLLITFERRRRMSKTPECLAPRVSREFTRCSSESCVALMYALDIVYHLVFETSSDRFETPAALRTSCLSPVPALSPSSLNREMALLNWLTASIFCHQTISPSHLSCSIGTTTRQNCFKVDTVDRSSWARAKKPQ